MANYQGVLLQQKKEFIEGCSFDINFLIKDELNDVVSAESLASFKFYCYISNDSDELIKYDVNYSGGAATQIELSGKEVVVHVVEDDTDDYEGLYTVELRMVNKTTGNDYCVFKKLINIVDTITD